MIVSALYWYRHCHLEVNGHVKSEFHLQQQPCTIHHVSDVNVYLGYTEEVIKVSEQKSVTHTHTPSLSCTMTDNVFTLLTFENLTHKLILQKRSFRVH